MLPSAAAVRRTIGPICLGLGLVLTLAACSSGGDEGSNAVAMKDLEVVDGTATDAMTDLDGVRTEGTAMAPVVANSAASPTPAKAANATEPAEADAEVLSDQ